MHGVLYIYFEKFNQVIIKHPYYSLKFYIKRLYDINSWNKATKIFIKIVRIQFCFLKSSSC